LANGVLKEVGAVWKKGTEVSELASCQRARGKGKFFSSEGRKVANPNAGGAQNPVGNQKGTHVTEGKNCILLAVKKGKMKKGRGRGLA